MNKAVFTLLSGLLTSGVCHADVTLHCNWSVEKSGNSILLTQASPAGCLGLSEQQQSLLRSGGVRLDHIPAIEQSNPPPCPKGYEQYGEVQGGLLSTALESSVFSTTEYRSYVSRRICLSPNMTKRAKDNWQQLSNDLENASSTAIETSRQLLRELLKEAQQELEK